MSNEKAKYWPDSVDAKIKELRKGDSITIFWIDASQSSNVPIKAVVSNQNVETTCQSQGLFYGIQAGETYHDKHLLIVKNYLDNERITIESIPICLIKEIDIFNKKGLMSSEHQQGATISYADGSVKRIKFWQNQTRND